ncbi:MAG: Gfo/Idh/MocA family oxidoreductase [Verrucomicrobia bacterium]|nr:Gfo/Idh/MocA family oxidoreductase [Verrucomicrobiota bacterium]
MIKPIFARPFIPLFLVCALDAQTPQRATVAVITNHEGAHLSAYFPALAESAETGSVLLADPSGKTIAEARKTLGPKLANTYFSARDLFAQHRPQLTLVSLEPKLAPAAIDAALEAGSHVIAEKPACLSLAEFARLSQKANGRKLHLMLALANRLNPETRFALDLIRQNKLGKIYGVELHLIADQTRLTKPGYEKSWYAQKSRAGGGHLIWLGLHWIDIAMYLTGSDVTDVSGFTANIGGQPLDVEDSAALTLKFGNGALGTMTSGYYLDKGYHSHVKIWGATGWIETNRHGAAVPFRYYSTTDAKPEVKTYSAPDGPAGYTPFVAACVRAALGLEPPPVTTNDSLRIIRTVFTAYRAAETGQAQRIPSPRAP